MKKETKNKSFTLIIQAFSHIQDDNVLNLLHAFVPLVGLKELQIKAKIWSRGRSLYKRYKSAEKSMAKLKQQQFNSADIIYNFPPFCVTPKIEICQIRQELEMSPTNTLWADTTDYEAEGHKAEELRMSYESREINLRFNRIERCPTLAITKIELNSCLKKNDLYKKIHDLFANSFSHQLLLKQIGGCADIYEHNIPFPILNLLSDLGPWPKAYPLLENYFDDLHPILIGKLNLCNKTAEILGSSVNLKTVISNNQSSKTGVLYIPEKIISQKKVRELVKQCLLPKDESTAHCKADPDLGEFELLPAKITIFTAKRLKELREQKMFPVSKNLYAVPVILSKYCTMIDLDPDHMVVYFVDRYIADQLKQNIDSFFTEMTEELMISKRIYLAHQKAWEQIGCVTLMSFIKEKYFKSLM